MARRSRLSIDAELELLTIQLLSLEQKEDQFQRIIDDLHKMKDEVKKDRKCLEAKRNDLEAEKEPINWLPTELLIQIFVALAELDSQGCRTALSISHTSTKWRSIALSTPRLWTRLVLHGFRKSESRLGQIYLERSRSAPLEIDFHSLPDTMPTHECFQTAEFLAKSQSHFTRLESLSLQTGSAIAMIYLLPYLNDHSNTFPQLRSLMLAITTPNPTFIEAQAFLDRETNAMKELKGRGSSEKAAGSTSRLLHLKLEQVPLFSIPVSLISNLRSLELTYSPRKRNLHTRHHYYLRMSTLCEFLALTRLLEGLVLANTVPHFDVPENAATGNTATAPIAPHPIRLDHLTSIDWTYPSPNDVHRFFSLLDAPALDRLDLWVEEARAPRHDPLTAYPIAPPAERYTRRVVTYPALRSLVLQCADEDTPAAVLRRLTVPALQTVEFAHCAAGALPTFPRLEGVFRDPRLLNLTHLTLARYRISGESGRAEALLGYMPVLASLSLDACAGLGRLLAGLRETGGGKEGARRAVKVCPRLAALSLWDCDDVDYASLRAVVLARNGGADECVPRSGPAPDGETGGVTQAALGGATGGAQTPEEAQVGRKIKPLRRQRRHRPELGASTDASAEVPSPIASTIIAMEESFQPAHISFLRVDNCKLMGRDDVLALRDLGVVDVIWAGSG